HPLPSFPSLLSPASSNLSVARTPPPASSPSPTRSRLGFCPPPPPQPTSPSSSPPPHPSPLARSSASRTARREAGTRAWPKFGARGKACGGHHGAPMDPAWDGHGRDQRPPDRAQCMASRGLVPKKEETDAAASLPRLPPHPLPLRLHLLRPASRARARTCRGLLRPRVLQPEPSRAHGRRRCPR
ncbi:unnamed protein product, partial [Urochloa humidicola]